MSASVQPTQPTKSATAQTGELSPTTGGFKIDDLRRCGRYTAYLALTYFIMVLAQVCNLLFMTFADRKPKMLDQCNERYPTYINTKNCTRGICTVLINGTSVICSEKTYDFIPITSEFDIPTEQVKLGTTIQNIGLMVGAIVFGNLADTIGRKFVLLTVSAGLLVFTIGTSFAPTFIWFTVLRFSDMVFTGGQHCVCNPYFMENLPDKHRMWVATVVTYSPNYVILAGIAYVCGEWRTLARAAAGITLIPLFLLPFLKDTPRWLVSKAKTARATRAAIYIKKWDDKVTPEEEKEITLAVERAVKVEVEKQSKKKKNYYFWHLFMNKQLACYAIVFATSLFSTSFISYGIAYNLDAIAGNVYLNVVILGLARYAINISAAILEYTVKSVGRRLLHCVAVGSIAFTMGAIFIVYVAMWPSIENYKEIVRNGGEGDPSVRIIVVVTSYAALLASAMCTELFVLDSVQPAELFPTPIRSTGIAFIQVFNRLGTIVSPLVFIPSKSWPPTPFLMMFFTAAADFILYFLLIPETRGKKLPDQMPDDVDKKDDLEKADMKNAPAPKNESESAASITGGSATESAR